MDTYIWNQSVRNTKVLGYKTNLMCSGIYGFRGNRKMPFLKITMALPRLIAPAKRLLEQGFQFEGYPLHGYQSYESNIDFEIR